MSDLRLPSSRKPCLKKSLRNLCGSLVIANSTRWGLLFEGGFALYGCMKYLFDTCVLDTVRNELYRDGAPVHVEPQVFDLLVYLASRSGETVSKDELVQVVWKGLAISDATISARISRARGAIGDSGAQQRLIRTVQRRGFCMIATVETDLAGVDHLPEPLVSDIQYASSADGSAIAWTASGSGPNLIRIGHWLSHLELDPQTSYWAPMLDRLGQHHRLVRYDIRGTGLSSRDAPIEGISAFVDDLLAVADASGAKTFSMFAASLAVPVAIEFAAKYPDRIDRMVLYGGFTKGRAYRGQLPGQMDEDTALAMVRAGWGQPGSAFLKAFSTIFMPDATPDQIAEFVLMQVESADAETAVSLRRVVDRFVVEDTLDKVNVPTLVLHAIDDSIHPISEGQKLAAGIKGARLVRLNSANHMPLPQDPAWSVLMDEVDRFLND